MRSPLWELIGLGVWGRIGFSRPSCSECLPWLRAFRFPLEDRLAALGGHVAERLPALSCVCCYSLVGYGQYCSCAICYESSVCAVLVLNLLFTEDAKGQLFVTVIRATNLNLPAFRWFPPQACPRMLQSVSVCE